MSQYLIDMTWCHRVWRVLLTMTTDSVPARLGKGQGAKEIGHNLAREQPKFGHNLVRKRHKIVHSLECDR